MLAEALDLRIGDLLAKACNPLHRYSVRHSAWLEYEACCWFRAHAQRGLAYPLVPIEYRDRVYAMIVAHNVRTA